MSVLLLLLLLIIVVGLGLLGIVVAVVKIAGSRPRQTGPYGGSQPYAPPPQQWQGPPGQPGALQPPQGQPYGQGQYPPAPTQEPQAPQPTQAPQPNWATPQGPRVVPGPDDPQPPVG